MLSQPSIRTLPRIFLVGLLAVALWNPPAPWQSAPRDVIVLLDESFSVDRASSDPAWASVTRAVRGLPPGSDFALIRFAAEAVLEVPMSPTAAALLPDLLAGRAAPRTHALDRSATDIAAALETGLRLARPGRATRLVLISDGQATRGQAGEMLQQARSAAIPVYALQPAAPAERDDSWIQSLHTPGRIRIDQQLPLSVSVSSTADAGGSLHLSVAGETQITRSISLRGTHTDSYDFLLQARHVGANTVAVRLQADNDSEARNNIASTIVNVEGPAPVLYVSSRSKASPLARGLHIGGRQVAAIRPDGFAQALDRLPDPGAIILDDVSVTDLPAPAWDQLAKSVRTGGSGLMVLGGPRSFGAGAYRHSRLEELLPVTAEAHEPQPQAAILFMVDTSGSMDRSGMTISRLTLARRAIQETANTLLDGDLVGLLAFDIEPRLLLPLGPHAHASAALDRAWQAQAAGGTRLRPALAEAVPTLAAATAQKKLLVLVTDGFVADEALQGIESQIAGAGIDVIAMAVGADADRAVLARLAAINDGQLLRIADIATLPRLMRHAVEQRRPMSETGIIHPLQTRPLPFPIDAAAGWPALGGYMVTRARPSASVYLRAANGDPLLAARHAGAGRVVVLPGGLGAWAGDWLDWPEYGKFLAGLLGWVSGQSDTAGLFLQVRQLPGELHFSIDTGAQVTDEGDAETPASLLLRDPNDRLQDVSLNPVAPARLEAKYPVTHAGRYAATVHIGDASLQHELLYLDNREFVPRAPHTPTLDDWIRQGLLTPWSAGALRADGPDSDLVPGVRDLLLATTALLYLLLLLLERRPDLLRTRRRTRAAPGEHPARSAPDGKLSADAAAEPRPGRSAHG